MSKGRPVPIFMLSADARPAVERRRPRGGDHVRLLPHPAQCDIATDMRGVPAGPAVIATLASIGMAADGTTQAEFAAILDKQRAKWAAIAPDHRIKPVHG